MWHFISERISEATGALFVCQSRTEVQGGDTHQCYVIRDDTHRYFVKVCAQQCHGQLACEADGLKAIAKTGQLLTPPLICHGSVELGHQESEYLVLGFVRFISPEASHWYMLGEQLARLHQQPTDGQYGWRTDNFIGKTRQKNQWNGNWACFFAEQRIGWMLEELARHNQRLVNIDVFITQIAQFLSSHRPEPALLHGDLWSGNASICKRGPIVYDPAVYIGDRETDLAMSELFGAFPAGFYQGYHDTYAIDGDYARRKSLYQLYHLLNHALIFGGHYLASCKSAIIHFQQQL
ncbi:fructosamine kinase family protein [Alteromonas aestuariivivens]|uniref:Fructosamine kinase family protein n=1 Tax=Alteromonas aestuariivivens TaxID=1938339 RepID=A0A3D8MBC2_9ALTE|nr:fructosamine kinase family protein [Alteromonas aestuariivivens]RDV27517.1 fructosamine kinase family protein [Alteromonas aestuariivivens]